MSDEHVMASNPRSREMVDVVLAEFDRWARYAPGQAAGMYPNDPKKAAGHALYDVRTDLADHLVVQVGITLGVWQLEDE